MKYFKTIVLAIFMLISSQAWSATYYVSLTGDNSDGSTWAKAYITIQAGINAAGSGDTVLVADGTYTGAGNVNLDYGAAPNDFTVQSYTRLGAIIDGEGTADTRGFVFNDAEGRGSIVDGFTITRCVSPAGGGGGMEIYASAPTIIRCWFKDCSGNWGAGIHATVVGADPLIEMCLFTGCSVTGGGGAIVIDSSTTTATIRNVTITNCSTANDAPGMYIEKASTITNLISYGNVMAGVTNENVLSGCTPTYSVYDYANTANDTPGAGCLDSASNNPGFDPLFTPTNILVKEGGADAWAGVDQTDIYGVTIDVSESIPMGASNQVPIVGGSLGLGLDLGL